MSRTLILAGLLVVLTVFPNVASAAGDPVEVRRFKDWSVYIVSDPGGPMCFAASQPKRSSYVPDNVKSRDPAFFMITSVPSRRVRNEASTIIGYPFEYNSFVVVDVDGARFEMFTNNDTAWLTDLARQETLVDRIRRGRSMVVQGKSRRGTKTTDVYSLAGSAAAVDAVPGVCSR